MARIFISYRREDGIAQTGRIYDRLVMRLGETDVFMDLGKISAGSDFTQVLDDKLAECEVFIAIIGPRWLVSRKGRKRLEDPEDFVRREIAAALRRGVRVLPVLIDGAQMPSAAELPAELAGLARRNAVSLRHERFDVDMDSLILDIEEPDRPPEDTLLNRLQGMRERWRHGRNAALVGIAVVLASALASWTGLLDLFALDTRLNTLVLSLAELADAPIPDARVVVVGIDRDTEARLGGPFDRRWRSHHASLLGALARAPARSVSFDMYFEEPTEHDAELVAAISGARARGVQVYVGARPTAAGVSRTLPAVREAVSGEGLLCVGARLGLASTAPLLVARRQDDTAASLWTDKRPALGLLAALGYAEATAPDRALRRLLVPVPGRVREIDLAELERVTATSAACSGVWQGDTVAQLLIDLSLSGHWRRAPALVKYEELALAADTAAQAIDSLAGKIVLVGVTGTAASADEHRVVRGFVRDFRHGVELHADVASNLLADAQLHPLHWGGQLFLTVFSVGMAVLVRLVCANRRPLIRRALFLAALAAYLWLAVYLCSRHHVVLNAAYHLAAFFAAWWLVDVIRRGRLQRAAAPAPAPA